MNTLEPSVIFPTTIYKINKQEYLKDALDVVNEYLSKIENKNQLVYQTEMIKDERLQSLVNFVAQCSWTILDSQGFNMFNMETIMTDCWGQMFETGGQHNEHIHAYNTQMSAFYFLETTDNSSMLSLYDPRHTKRQINLLEKDNTNVTEASEGILFKVNSGDLYLTNSWLPHGFTPNQSKEPFKFIHFNLTVAPLHQHAEVI